MQPRTLIATIFISLTLLSPANAATMRCKNGQLAQTGDSTAIVYRNCGRPSARRISGRIRHNALYIFVEKWSYVPRSGKLVKHLEFHDGILKKITQGRRVK